MGRVKSNEVRTVLAHREELGERRGNAVCSDFESDIGLQRLHGQKMRWKQIVPAETRLSVCNLLSANQTDQNIVLLSILRLRRLQTLSRNIRKGA